MHNALSVLTDELRRLKSAGIKTVSVSPDSIAALRSAMAKSSARGGDTSDAISSRSAPRVEREEAAPPPRTAAAPNGRGNSSIGSVQVARGVSEGGGGPAPSPTNKPAIVVPAPRPPVVIEGRDKKERWEKLKDLVLNDPECRKHVRPGKKVVLGVGTLDAKIMFVGEAPGGEEEIQGEPFVGPAGQLLTRMIQAMGLKREDVYIGNIMNWRPEMPVSADGTQYGNRPPNAEEMAYCLPYLKAQIDIVAPDYLVALGSSAAQGLLGPGTFKALGEVRGRWKEFQGRPLMITYHPSFILRNQSNKSKRLIWEDLLQVMDKSGLPVSDKQRGYFLEK